MCNSKEVCVSKFEIISLTISILALIISTVSIVRARKTQSSFLELEKVHVELSKKQIEEINNTENLKNKTNLKINIYDGSLVITNTGATIARNIEIIFDDIKSDCILSSEKSKLPYSILNPNEEFKLIASYNTKCVPQLVPIKIQWGNMDNSIGKYESVLQP